MKRLRVETQSLQLIELIIVEMIRKILICGEIVPLNWSWENNKSPIRMKCQQSEEVVTPTRLKRLHKSQTVEYNSWILKTEGHQTRNWLRGKITKSDPYKQIQLSSINTFRKLINARTCNKYFKRLKLASKKCFNVGLSLYCYTIRSSQTCINKRKILRLSPLQSWMNNLRSLSVQRKIRSIFNIFLRA